MVPRVLPGSFGVPAGVHSDAPLVAGQLAAAASNLGPNLGSESAQPGASDLTPRFTSLSADVRAVFLLVSRALPGSSGVPAPGSSSVPAPHVLVKAPPVSMKSAPVKPPPAARQAPSG